MLRTLSVATALLMLIPALVAAEGNPSRLEAEGLRVAEAVFCTAVVDRMPDGGAESYPLGTQVYYWSRILGGKQGEIVYHVWFLDDVELQSVELPLGASHWRTWSYKTLFPGQDGLWRVEVQNASSEVLSSHSFTATK